MLRINFVGDFRVKDVSNLIFHESLKRELGGADVNVLNFEAPINTEGQKPIKKHGPNLSQSAEAPSYIEDCGFNVVSLANNHAMDYGSEGLLKTREAFKRAVTVGAGGWSEAYDYKILNINNVIIGFIALTHGEFGCLSDYLYDKESIGTACLTHPIVDEIILKAKKDCDFLFILPHAGMEQQDYPLPEMVTLYRHFINMGADGVFASHSHTPQCREIYKGKPILYGLGNFCFDKLSTDVPRYWYWSLFATVIIEENKKMTLKIQGCYYNELEHIVKIIDDNKEYNEHISNINAAFADEKEYKQRVDEACLNQYWIYERNFSSAGFYRMSLIRVIKQFAKKILNIKSVNNLPLLNSIRCETHRWTLKRILQLK